MSLLLSFVALVALGGVLVRLFWVWSFVAPLGVALGHVTVPTLAIAFAHVADATIPKILPLKLYLAEPFLPGFIGLRIIFAIQAIH